MDPRITVRALGVDGIHLVHVDGRGLLWCWQTPGRPTVRLRAVLDGDRIVFLGGRYGEHSLAVACSSADRVIAHWRGYCEANGAAAAAAHRWGGSP